MSGIPVTFTGNLARDPELKDTASGTPVCSFTIAVTDREMDKETGKWADGKTSWVRCAAFGDLAAHIAGSAGKGTRLIVTGRMSQREWTGKDGTKRDTFEVVADDAALSLKWTATKPA